MHSVFESQYVLYGGAARARRASAKDTSTSTLDNIAKDINTYFQMVRVIS